MASRPQSTKSRAKRIALSYFKEPHPFRRWKFILSVAAPVVAGLWLLVVARLVLAFALPGRVG